MIKLNKQLEDVISITGQDVSNYQLNLFHDYVDILFKWHEKHNILSTRNVEYFIKRDFFDTVSFVGYLPYGLHIDVGTGAGIPGIILSILRNDNNFILVDRREKAIRFLEHVKIKLNLKNIDIVKTDINSLSIGNTPNSILIKNFSNKVVSKMNFIQKVKYIYKLMKSRIKGRYKVLMMTGSNALVIPNIIKIDDRITAKCTIHKIKTPFFPTNRFILEIL